MPSKSFTFCAWKIVLSHYALSSSFNVLTSPDGNLELCGGDLGTTNNRMELTAAIRALEHFPDGAQLEMRCDSQYVIKSVTEWMRGWKAKGWRTTTGEVKNVDLMKRLDELASSRERRAHTMARSSSLAFQGSLWGRAERS
ncbi:hypothetical protein MOX02_52370 [Methylobacterium oxalidis]|uniref:ribonuclease H n=1 Tax=Methylobacterium oxalidis TaxID=944322 RepID=A0A512JBE3_9HYPH|nr:hypothetical protein MOX02_52370 [Methylobacterium oxalidis]GJE31494.1 Ribonuclease H [Methylobacterium oxalidis]GLS65789.1 hypothetical protein GCM10007888_41710 [Methylobacterium oxalidis]